MPPPSTTSSESDARESSAPRLRHQHHASLTAPLDDMWGAFADSAEQHPLRLGNMGDEIVGCCAVDEERRMLRFWVEPQHQGDATPLLRKAIEEFGVERLMVQSVDPLFLSSALDLELPHRVHSLLYSLTAEAAVAPLEGLRLAPADDLETVVDWEERTLGAPRTFLEHYLGERIERRELFLHEPDGELEAVGELRLDPRRNDVAHLGVVVGEACRGRGLASAVLTALTDLCRDRRLLAHCSTEVGNVGARKAIERAGFRAHGRLLEFATSG